MESNCFVEISKKESNILMNKEYPVDERNPLLIPEEGYWFYFYEKDEDGMRYNYSPKYYFGKRIKALDILDRSEEYPNDELYAFLKELVIDDGLLSVVINEDHTVICCSDEEGVTVDEYALNASNDSREKVIDRKHFLQGIAYVLNKYEKDKFKFREEVQTLNNEKSVVSFRSMSIDKNDESITNDCRIMSYILECKDSTVENYSVDKFISCIEAELCITDLYYDYPYLEPLMERIKIKAMRKQDIVTNKEIVSLAEELIKEKTEDFARTLKK